jgi:hypothetical protein
MHSTILWTPSVQSLLNLVVEDFPFVLESSSRIFSPFICSCASHRKEIVGLIPSTR